MIRLTLTVKPRKFVTLNNTICDNDSVWFGGQWRKTSGIYNVTNTASNGCDSITTLNLNVKPTKSTAINQSICQGQSVLFFGENKTLSGTYIGKTSAANGCDSVVTLNLVVLPNSEYSFSATICDGESYSFLNNNITIAGTYTDTTASGNGCDSVITLQLRVNPLPKRDTSFIFCPGDTLRTFDPPIVRSGVYSFPIISTEGCTGTFTVSALANDDTCAIRGSSGGDFIIPNIITPNADGLNDNLIFPFLSKFDRVGLEVTNRWGQIVYFSENYQNQFTALGVPSGVYYLKIELHSGAITKQIRGWLSVVR